ncbi:carbohydrate sulfotransferase 15-like [Babylonia areolata]|uniref:carbohydrate sulfotransferase 15-like n=1 Tax=Babylonia areolata TaxID=304850 RepID=UPI003FCF064D
MRKGLSSRRTSLWCLTVLLLILTFTFISCFMFRLGKGYLPMPQRWKNLWGGVFPATSSAVTWSDLQEVWPWYQGSACSGRGEEVVGDQPFFPPCAPHLPQGVATWGSFPYVEPPPRYLPNSKNPCWRHEGRVLCVPYFFLIGVSKSGTTDLFSRLAFHPEVIRNRKETHFFDRRRYDRNMLFPKYVNWFRGTARRVQEDIRKQGHSRVICGDASPSYFYDNYFWKLYSGNENCTEPRVILAHHLFHLNPRLKIVMIIRHPVDRLYSRYLFDFGKLGRNYPPSPEEFHDFVVQCLHHYKLCFQRWSIRHCLYNRTLWESLPNENVYPVLMEDWLRVVPRDQFLFIRYEDYRQDMGRELRKVFHFLGLDPLSDKQLWKTTSAKIRNQGKWKRWPMLPETRQILQEFYQPFIRRFAAILNDRRFMWED